jgi:hypothetical protein
VLQVSAATITIPAPFERGAEIRLRDPRGLRDLVLDIFDLEGALIRRLRIPGPVFELGTAWNGEDEDGVRARQGYYIVRARYRDDQDRAHEIEHGLVLAD